MDDTDFPVSTARFLGDSVRGRKKAIDGTGMQFIHYVNYVLFSLHLIKVKGAFLFSFFSVRIGKRYK